jgi:hypothetical protein
VPGSMSDQSFLGHAAALPRRLWVDHRHRARSTSNSVQLLSPVTSSALESPRAQAAWARAPLTSNPVSAGDGQHLEY